MKKNISILLSIVFTFLFFQVNAQDFLMPKEDFNRVLLFKYKEGHNPEVKAEIGKLFKDMSKLIDDVEWVHIADLSKSSQGFEQVITVTFASKEGLEEYTTHPNHLRVQKIAPAVVAEFASYEFWEKLE